MATFLYKLGRLSFRRRWWVALVWLALLVGVGGAAATAGTPPTDEFALPGTESQDAFDLMEEEFPQAGAENLESQVVFQAPEGERLDTPAHQETIDDVRGLLVDGDLVVNVTDPFETSSVSEDASTAYLTVSYDAAWGDITHEMRQQLIDAMETGRDAGLAVEASGEVAMEEMEMGGGEIIGIVVAAIVLVITFGSLVAAGLPLLTALVGVGVAMIGIAALSSTLGLSETTGILAMMIGLAVGIDYALFIASRYRAELVEGHNQEEAAGRAVGTAGSAVVFAGLTVVIALAGLAVANVPILTKMGLAAAAAVVIAVFVALTLVPAALGMVGKRIFGRKLRAQNPETGVPASLNKAGKDNGGTRWAKAVLKRPGLVLAASVVGLGVLAIPVASIEQGLPDNGTQPEDTTLRQSYDMLSEGFGPGFNGPLMLVIDATGGADVEQVAADVTDRLGGLDGVVATAPPNVNPDGTVATVLAFPSTGPSDSATSDLVQHIRDDVAAQVESDTGAKVLVSGVTAAGIDFSKVMSDALVPYLTLVVGLAFVLLVLVFRSILVPLKAALGFLLSVLAALGAVVAVFQWGWAADLIGVHETGPIMSLMPIFMVGVIFGLAMDYEVFLVTRMREAYVHGEDARQSVISGFKLNARVVTAAAVIMISVFAGFAVTSDEAMIKMMGFGLATAVLLDAFVVRMTIVPALLGLIGDRAWWLPKWLDRILPNVDVEGESLERYLEANGKGRDSVTREREPAGVS
ncbi:MMPL family transporter [Streptomyces profundus]|uniref:MMPL family transporter n=1 Tax=Streptomyces profundus TaxID=2867410 RepID=UPI001D161D31|nr:MMPL family transporter [Streptomyces sp. MA3_2.13]UED85891.1 MMPL family transporter [Streptomyces sp. MA3_2.13]